MAGGMAQVGFDAQRFQAAKRRAVGPVRARNQVAQVTQYFGDTLHARAADTDEMNVLDRVFHTTSFISAVLRILDERNV